MCARSAVPVVDSNTNTGNTIDPSRLFALPPMESNFSLAPVPVPVSNSQHLVTNQIPHSNSNPQLNTSNRVPMANSNTTTTTTYPVPNQQFSAPYNPNNPSIVNHHHNNNNNAPMPQLSIGNNHPPAPYLYNPNANRGPNYPPPTY